MLLVIDSATAACSAALIEDDRLLDERHELVGRGHAERLLPMIADLLAGRIPTAILVDCGFRDGTVYLAMPGASSGCPSSTMTLKSGIEGLLKHFVPEVETVEAV